jgi:hypothetical protein
MIMYGHAFDPLLLDTFLCTALSTDIQATQSFVTGATRRTKTVRYRRHSILPRIKGLIFGTLLTHMVIYSYPTLPPHISCRWSLPEISKRPRWQSGCVIVGTGLLNGRSEELLGRFKREYVGSEAQRNNIRIATKFAPYPWRCSSFVLSSGRGTILSSVHVLHCRKLDFGRLCAG